MNLFSRHQLEDSAGNSTITLYLNRSSTEFSDELGYIIDERNIVLIDAVKSYLKLNFPDKDIKTAKIMLGSIRLAVIPL